MKNKTSEELYKEYLFQLDTTFKVEPTYYYQIGDNVKVGYLEDCVISNIFEDGYVYEIDYTYTKRDIRIEHSKIIMPWHNVRPISERFDYEIYKDDGLDGLNFYKTTIDSIIHKCLSRGVNMNPSYQRNYCWDSKDKELLLDSIYRNIDIGKFVFRRLDYDNDIGYEIIDGKQRLSTLLDFYLNKLQYKGKYYNDLSLKDRLHFDNFNTICTEISDIDDKKVVEYFIKLNTCGKVMDSKHLDKIREEFSYE